MTKFVNLTIRLEENSADTAVAPRQTEPNVFSVSLPVSEMEEEESIIIQPSSVFTQLGPVKRTKIGYGLRDDLIKNFKQIALDENKKIYEVMETALSDYLVRYAGLHPEFIPKAK